jgi:hypothetical protein
MKLNVVEWRLTTLQYLSIRELGKSLAGRGLSSPCVQYVCPYFVLCLVLTDFTYGLFNGAVVVWNDVASIPVHMTTPSFLIYLKYPTIDACVSKVSFPSGFPTKILY